MGVRECVLCGNDPSRGKVFVQLQCNTHGLSSIKLRYSDVNFINSTIIKKHIKAVIIRFVRESLAMIVEQWLQLL